MKCKVYADERHALFSEDRRYRYLLTIRWDDRPCINFLMLNPSTADEYHNDPTVERCERRAKMWGYGGLIITNIFAFRSTDPKMLILEYAAKRNHLAVVGKNNDMHIIAAALSCEGTICGWGNNGELAGRGKFVRGLMRILEIPVYYLRLSDSGNPYHPLYVPYSTMPTLWE